MFRHPEGGRHGTGRRRRSVRRPGLRAEIDGGVAHALDEFAASLGRDLRSQRFLLLLEVAELDFHQAVRGESGFEAVEKGVGHAGVAEFDGGFEPLGTGAEIAPGGTGEWLGHWASLRAAARAGKRRYGFGMIPLLSSFSTFGRMTAWQYGFLLPFRR